MTKNAKIYLEAQKLTKITANLFFELNPAKKVSLGPSVQSFPAQNIKLERESPPREVVQDSSENSASQGVKAEENFSENPRQNVHRASSWNELQDHVTYYSQFSSSNIVENNSDASLEPSVTFFFSLIISKFPMRKPNQQNQILKMFGNRST